MVQKAYTRKGTQSFGPVQEDYREWSIKTDSARYSEMLTAMLKPAIRIQGQGQLFNFVLLLHDNARLQTASVV
jgi:hypothetical protein